jgi:cytochrome c oxidase assembly protein Cox11
MPARGKPPKLALNALMRTLLVTFDAMMRTGTTWRMRAAGECMTVADGRAGATRACLSMPRPSGQSGAVTI